MDLLKSALALVFINLVITSFMLINSAFTKVLRTIIMIIIGVVLLAVVLVFNEAKTTQSPVTWTAIWTQTHDLVRHMYRYAVYALDYVGMQLWNAANLYHSRTVKQSYTSKLKNQLMHFINKLHDVCFT